MWHNETVNVWTHLLGCILFATLAVWIKIYLVPVFKSDQDSLDAWLLNLDQFNKSAGEPVCHPFTSFSNNQNDSPRSLPCDGFEEYVVLKDLLNSD
jgi:hypothetical protein